VCSALAESGKSSRQGSAIVNLSSIAGILGAQLDPLYSMTKGGVRDRARDRRDRVDGHRFHCHRPE
jgi:NAD(P)-dependent dehydrogenase (short-subunit alcohol dehydrogenase family)